MPPPVSWQALAIAARLAALMIWPAPTVSTQAAKDQSAELITGIRPYGDVCRIPVLTEEGGKANRVTATTLDPIFAGSVIRRFNPFFSFSLRPIGSLV